MMSQLSNEFLFWLEQQVYDSAWQLDPDLLDFLLGSDQ
jgi:hypothetical protein